MTTHNAARSRRQPPAKPARERIDVDALLAQSGLSRREIGRRKGFLEFGAQDVHRLSALAPMAAAKSNGAGHQRRSAG